MCIYCGTNKYRKIYEEHNGPIPEKYEIHHIDGNYLNNDPTNLACVPTEEHYAIHYSQEDWMDCLKMSRRMKLRPNIKSDLSNRWERKRIEAKEDIIFLRTHNSLELKKASGI